MRPGDPDGRGRYAVLDVDDDGRITCHECGRTYQHLATHVRGAHGITAAAYRDAHGLGATTRLVGPGPRARMREAWDRDREARLRVLEEHRDPLRARLSSRAVTKAAPWAPEVRAKRSAAGKALRGRPLTDAERAQLDATGVDLRAWADVARALLALPGVSARSIADVSDISPGTVRQRIARYPAR